MLLKTLYFNLKLDFLMILSFYLRIFLFVFLYIRKTEIMSIVDAFVDQLKKQRIKEQPLYLLIDPLGSILTSDALSLASLKARFGEASITPVFRPNLAHEPHNCPHLVLLSSAEESFENALEQDLIGLITAALRHAFYERPSRKRYICGFLQSSASSQVVAQHLVGQMIHWKSPAFIGQARNNENTFLFPTHQPLLQELAAFASAHSKADTYSNWLWPISQWIIPTVGHTFLQLKGSAPSQANSASALPVASIEAFKHSSYVAHTLQLWQRMASAPITAAQRQQSPLLRQGAALPEHAAYTVLQHVQLGLRLGLSDRHDLATFAVMKNIAHPHFEQHRFIQTALQRAAQGGHFTQEVGKISHPQWLQMLYELNQAFSPRGASYV